MKPSNGRTFTVPKSEAPLLDVRIVPASTGITPYNTSLPGVITGSQSVLQIGYAISAFPPVADTDDPTSGAVVLALLPAEYRFSVMTGPSDRWHLSLEQLTTVTSSALPRSWSGDGPEVVGPFHAGATLQISARDLSDNVQLAQPSEPFGPVPHGYAFAGELFSASTGKPVAIVFQGRTPYQGRVTTTTPVGGSYYLSIFAWGPWMISVDP